MGADTVKSAMFGSVDAVTTAKLSWGGETKLRRAFFKELPKVTPVGAIGRYPGPLRVIVRLKERIVTPQPAAGQILLDYHQGPDGLITVDSDHDWNAGTTTKTVDEVLLPATVEWFRSNF
jgi:hypothetical protein